MRSRSASGVICCLASLQAWSGSWWLSIIVPVEAEVEGLLGHGRQRIAPPADVAGVAE